METKNIKGHFCGTEVKIMCCPFCSIYFTKEDLKDYFSIKEANISNLCQKCQDAVFDEEEE